jgi:hypothetical protein
MYILSYKIRYITLYITSSLRLGIFNDGLKMAVPLPTGRRQEVLRPHKGPDREGAKGVPQERRQVSDRMRLGIFDGLALYAELADAIEKRPEETSRR